MSIERQKEDKGIYEFDGNTCTYEEGYVLTQKYLRTTALGVEEVCNAVEWTRYGIFQTRY